MKKILLSRRAFSLLEVMITVIVISLMVAVGLAAIHNAQTNTENRAADGLAYQLNMAINRARLRGDTNPVLAGNDAAAAAVYLFEQGYIQ